VLKGNHTKLAQSQECKSSFCLLAEIDICPYWLQPLQFLPIGLYIVAHLDVLALPVGLVHCSLLLEAMGEADGEAFLLWIRYLRIVQ